MFESSNKANFATKLLLRRAIESSSGEDHDDTRSSSHNRTKGNLSG